MKFKPRRRTTCQRRDLVRQLQTCTCGILGTASHMEHRMGRIWGFSALLFRVSRRIPVFLVPRCIAVQMPRCLEARSLCDMRLLMISFASVTPCQTRHFGPSIDRATKATRSLEPRNSGMCKGDDRVHCSSSRGMSLCSLLATLTHKRMLGQFTVETAATRSSVCTETI